MRWLLALHVIFFVTWFAGLFYLPRLFVYHAECSDSTGNQRFKLMERKLFNGVMLPSAILIGISGYWLFIIYEHTHSSHQWWLYIKIFLVLTLYCYMFLCWKYLRDFKHDRNKHTHMFYRWFNEYPSIILVTVVILAIVKPF